MALTDNSVFVSGVTLKAVSVPKSAPAPADKAPDKAPAAITPVEQGDDNHEVFSEPEPEDETGLDLDDPEVYEELFGYKRKAMKAPAGGASGKAAKSTASQAPAGAAAAGSSVDNAGGARSGSKGGSGKGAVKATGKAAAAAAPVVAEPAAAAPAPTPTTGSRRSGRRKDGTGAGAGAAQAAATTQDDGNNRRSNWVQCSDCCQWRVVPDQYWALIQTSGDQEWFCKDATWNVVQHEPYTPPCGQA